MSKPHWRVWILVIIYFFSMSLGGWRPLWESVELKPRLFLFLQLQLMPIRCGRRIPLLAFHRLCLIDQNTVWSEKCWHLVFQQGGLSAPCYDSLSFQVPQKENDKNSAGRAETRAAENPRIVHIYSFPSVLWKDIYCKCLIHLGTFSACLHLQRFAHSDTFNRKSDLWTIV